MILSLPNLFLDLYTNINGTNDIFEKVPFDILMNDQSDGEN